VKGGGIGILEEGSDHHQWDGYSVSFYWKNCEIFWGLEDRYWKWLAHIFYVHVCRRQGLLIARRPRESLLECIWSKCTSARFIHLGVSKAEGQRMFGLDLGAVICLERRHSSDWRRSCILVIRIFFQAKLCTFLRRRLSRGGFFFKEKLGLLDVFWFCEAGIRQEEADWQNQEEVRQHI
jgi:hypothetical protein